MQVFTKTSEMVVKEFIFRMLQKVTAKVLHHD